MSAAAGLDWQFVIVTLAAVWGGWVLLRPLWRIRGARKATGACGRCSSADCGSAAVPKTSSGLVRIGSGAPRKRSERMPPGGRA